MSYFLPAATPPLQFQIAPSLPQLLVLAARLSLWLFPLLSATFRTVQTPRDQSPGSSSGKTTKMSHNTGLCWGMESLGLCTVALISISCPQRLSCGASSLFPDCDWQDPAACLPSAPDLGPLLDLGLFHSNQQGVWVLQLVNLTLGCCEDTSELSSFTYPHPGWVFM